MTVLRLSLPTPDLVRPKEPIIGSDTVVSPVPPMVLFASRVMSLTTIACAAKPVPLDRVTAGVEV